jgi:hypothetical protein
MLQLEQVIFSEGLLKIPPVLHRKVIDDVLDVAAAYYSYKIETEKNRLSREIENLKARLESASPEGLDLKDVYSETLKQIEKV